ncbi:Protein of uncharacterised function (DUF3053) [Leminorella richardii]|uniref:Protein of uncharacterized function (DUF3053) n=1 Tax=Leminorella richardii TaxID=158841 RepID=A0A2X4V157_9GAMM|nr:DUF3053 family protein [Leminorella richardii]SQI39010.1 Protein of uncharacterised function (DUF3053) [Leminorella richardii]
MFPSPRNSLRSLYALLFIILLSSIGGCDLKNKQRDAFAEYLELHILIMPTMTATQLDDEQLAAFGTYANHYRTLSDYDAIAAPLMFPFNQHFDLMWNVGSAQKLLDNRERLAELHDELLSGIGRLEQAFQRASQMPTDPALSGEVLDLYNRSFEKTVARPHLLMMAIFTASEKALAAEIDIANYVKAHNGKLEAQKRHPSFATEEERETYKKKVKLMGEHFNEVKKAGVQLRLASETNQQ